MRCVHTNPAWNTICEHSRHRWKRPQATAPSGDAPEHTVCLCSTAHPGPNAARQTTGAYHRHNTRRSRQSRTNLSKPTSIGACCAGQGAPLWSAAQVADKAKKPSHRHGCGQAGFRPIVGQDSQSISISRSGSAGRLVYKSKNRRGHDRRVQTAAHDDVARDEAVARRVMGESAA
jgi:hypothetical protein